MSGDPFEQALRREQELKARRGMALVSRIRTVRPSSALAAAGIAVVCIGVGGLLLTRDGKGASSSQIPASPLGGQIRFAIGLANGRAQPSSYHTHFSGSFLAQVPSARIEAANAQLAVSAPWRFERFLAGPTGDSAVLIIKGSNNAETKVSIAIDSTGAITGLVFEPYPAAAVGATPAAVPSRELSGAATAVVGQLVARDFAAVRADFDNTMTNGLSQAALAAAWSSVTAPLGAFRTTDATILKHITPGVDTVFVPVTFERGAMEVQISFDAQRRIAGLYFRPPGFDTSI